MKNGKWLLLAGLVIMMMTIGCEKQMGFVAPNDGANDVGASVLPPLGRTYNTAGSWFLFYYCTPGAYPGTDFPMSIGQDNGATGSYVVVWQDQAAEKIYAEFHTAGNWYIQEAHFDVKLDSASLTHNKSGNLTPGKFPGQTKNAIPYPQVTLVAVDWTGPWDVPLAMAALCKVAQGEIREDEFGNDYWYYWNWNTGCGGEGDRPYKDVKLPADPVYLCLGSWPGAQWDWSFFMAEVSGIGPYPSGYNIWDGNWRGWCADAYVEIDVPWCGEVYLKSSLGPIPAAFNQDPVVWHRINYMLNHRLPDWEHNMWDFQTAAWALLGPIRPGLELSANAQAMYDDAMLNGGDFIPAPGQQVAVFVVPEAGQEEMGQPVFIQVDP